MAGRRGPRLLTSLAIAIATLMMPAGGTAQSATGDIHGIVVEQVGSPLAGVLIVVTDTATGMPRRTTTDVEGLFTVPGLPAGRYDVTATLNGFAAQRLEGLDLGVGRAIVANLELRRARLDETISLATHPPTIEALRTDLNSPITAIEIEALPLDARDVLQLALLAPGVTRGDPADGDISVAAASASMNALFVDGSDDRNPFFGTPIGRGRPGGRTYPLSREVVRDIQVSTSVAPAEYASGGGASVSVATRSGGNLLTARVFELYRPSSLRGQLPEESDLGHAAPSSRSNQFGGIAGGAIVRDRHFFLASYDGLRQQGEHGVFLGVPAGAPSDALTEAAIARLTPLAVNWDETLDQNLFFLRTDHRIADQHRLTLRYHQQHGDGNGLEAQGPRASVERGRLSRVRARSFGATAGQALSSTLFNDVRFQYTRERDTSVAAGDRPAADVFERGTLVLQAGSDAEGPLDVSVRRVQAADTLMWVRGRHTLKSGFDLNINEVGAAFSAGLTGGYVFQTLAGFATGVPNGPGDRYTQSFARNGQPLTIAPDRDEYAFFAEDKWRASDTVTIDAGLRFDIQRLGKSRAPIAESQLGSIGVEPDPGSTDSNDWGPRLGIAWAPSSRYVARAAYGVLYGRTPAAVAAAPLAYDGVSIQTVVLAGANGDPVPVYPARLTSVPDGVNAGPLAVFQHGFERPRVRQLSTSVEWEWMPSTLLSIAYLHTRGHQLLRATEQNLDAGVPVTLAVAGDSRTFAGETFGTRPLAGVGRIILLESNGQSMYNGLTVEMRRRLAQRLQYRLSYTIGKGTSNVPSIAAVVPESIFDRAIASPSEPLADRPADGDQRHRFLASVVTFTDTFAEKHGGFLKPILEGWRIGAVYTLQGGRPYTAYVNSDVNGDGNHLNDVAPGTLRNEFRMEKEGRLDGRLSRELDLVEGTHVTISVDVFNVFNSAHYREVDQILYTATGTELFVNPEFGERLNVRDPRVVQFGVSFGF